MKKLKQGFYKYTEQGKVNVHQYVYLTPRENGRVRLDYLIEGDFEDFDADAVKKLILYPVSRKEIDTTLDLMRRSLDIARKLYEKQYA